MISSLHSTRLRLVGVMALCILLVSVVSAASVDSHGMTYFPPDHVWNYPITNLPVNPSSSLWIQNMSSYSIKSCGGAGWCNGYEDRAWVYDAIPINWVNSSTPHVPVAFRANGPPYGNSDWIDAPVTPTSKVQTDNGDRHMIIVDTDEQKVYEFFQMINSGGNSWSCTGEFVWDLNGYRIQPNDVQHPPYGLASINAAGVPEIAGLVRYDEVHAGVVDHAVGGIIVQVNYSVSWPGSHKPPENNQAWSRSNEFPDYSQRMRLKDSVNISSFGPEAKVVATALKKYGVIIMDRGSLGVSLNIEQDSRFTSLKDLHTLKLSDFEFVDESSLMINASTAKVKTGAESGKTAPVSAFSANQTAGTAPLSVGFRDLSSNTPTNWDWYWGNNETKMSDLQNPTAVFTAAGTYHVRLYTSNAYGGDWENKTKYITVSPAASAPLPSFTSNVTAGTPPIAVQINNTTTGSSTGLDWLFEYLNHLWHVIFP